MTSLTMAGHCEHLPRQQPSESWMQNAEVQIKLRPLLSFHPIRLDLLQQPVFLEAGHTWQ